MKKMMGQFTKAGTVEWIGLRPARREPIQVVDQVKAIKGRGLEGDRATQSRKGNKRQVTLIQAEHLSAMASILGRDEIDPAQARRNIVVRGINLQSMKGFKINIGGAVLKITGPCHPCSRMEENFGKGGYNAMRGHGGWCAKVVSEGEIKVGDEVSPKGELDEEEE